MGACVSLPKLSLGYLLLLMFVALTGYCKSRVLSTLSTGISNMLGRMVMQPKTLRVLKQRAEMSARWQLASNLGDQATKDEFPGDNHI